MKFEMTLNCDDGTKIDLLPTTALIMMDETGEEQLLDPNYRIFGLGGCCILAGDYSANIATPWDKLRHDLGLSDRAFHTTDMKIGKKREGRINEFFSSNRFGRFATTVSAKTNNQTDYDLVNIVYRVFQNRIIDIIRWMNFTDIVIIHEDSKRLIPKLEQIVSAKFKFMHEGKEINVHYCKASKDLSLAGLEIADYIIHTAGSAVRDKNAGEIEKLADRPKFHNIFNSVDPKYSSFFDIGSIDHKDEVVRQ